MRTISDPRQLTQHDTVVTSGRGRHRPHRIDRACQRSARIEVADNPTQAPHRLLAANSIVPTPREVYQGFAEGRWPGSALVIATGPSRSGDIEMEITLGVHGPGEE